MPSILHFIPRAQPTSIELTVAPDGAITDAIVHAPNLYPESRDALQRALEGLRIEDAGGGGHWEVELSVAEIARARRR